MTGLSRAAVADTCSSLRGPDGPPPPEPSPRADSLGSSSAVAVMVGSYWTAMMHAVITVTVPANGDKRRARIYYLRCGVAALISFACAMTARAQAAVCPRIWLLWNLRCIPPSGVKVSSCKVRPSRYSWGLNADCAFPALDVSSLKRSIRHSGKVARGLKPALDAGMPRPPSDLLHIIQVSHIPERVPLAAADNRRVQPFPFHNYFPGFLRVSVGFFLFICLFFCFH